MCVSPRHGGGKGLIDGLALAGVEWLLQLLRWHLSLMGRRGTSGRGAG